MNENTEQQKVDWEKTAMDALKRMLELKASLALSDQVCLAAIGFFEHGGVKSVKILKQATEKWRDDFAKRLFQEKEQWNN